ncbi:MAG: NUDIX hydrolase [Rhodospirillaceae bacterium]|jgi:8-oxo-dGTP diphosphatase|nr:NUDIX hydrolase [Rhodospirillaceae bacterium]MBT5195700.1 NUDIX hydrolase [Rhodospirillaceae bacterium]MBT5895279.1 NUDIX hydrolase [Rhodospirillaceae bacterium]MBT6428691.1 NUDIX hydrolase [Rhodospirillaceae bacterium]MBT7759787.1 NUDIX hydrolase [Rhodospirillaceae bacterium]
MPRSYPDRPMVGVGAVVFRGPEVLMIRRGKPPRMGDWSLPGGMQELGETVFAAAAREVMEETAVTIANIALIDVVDSITPDQSGRVQFHYTLVDVVADWQNGDPVGGTDAMHAEFMPFDKVANLNLWSETHRIIAEARRMRGI